MKFFRRAVPPTPSAPVQIAPTQPVKRFEDPLPKGSVVELIKSASTHTGPPDNAPDREWLGQVTQTLAEYVVDVPKGFVVTEDILHPETMKVAAKVADAINAPRSGDLTASSLVLMYSQALSDYSSEHNMAHTVDTAVAVQDSADALLSALSEQANGAPVLRPRHDGAMRATSLAADRSPEGLQREVGRLMAYGVTELLYRNYKILNDRTEQYVQVPKGVSEAATHGKPHPSLVQALYETYRPGEPAPAQGEYGVPHSPPSVATPPEIEDPGMEHHL